MGKHSFYHASGVPSVHNDGRRVYLAHEPDAEPPRLPAALEAKLAELPPGPVRDEFILGVGRIGFEIGVAGLTPHQLDIIHLRAVQDVERRQTTAPLAQRFNNNRPSVENSVVYYIRLADDAVKIGTTTDIKRRVREMYRRPEDVIVTEPGDARLESVRHKQFAADKIDWPGSREVFRLSPTLRSHIEMLSKHQANAA